MAYPHGLPAHELTEVEEARYEAMEMKQLQKDITDALCSQTTRRNTQGAQAKEDATT